jgi:pyruvate/2-oxoglutarate dehydrogenase complex dihydrolipoamide dehydrogenase (E3) component
MIAEIKTIHPTKKVTVVHPTNDFFWFANKSGRARKHLNGLFKEWEIEEHAQERVVAIKQLGTSGYAVATESGKVLQADHVLVCIGIKPNSEYMREHYASTLTPNGYINVDEKLRVDPANNIFAFGDVIHFTPLPVEKMAFRAREQSGAAIANISKAVKGKTDSLESYKPDAKPFGSLPTLGYNDAILVVGVRLKSSQSSFVYGF